MQEKIVKSLNQITSKKLSGGASLPQIQDKNNPSSFQVKLDQSMTDKLLEKVKGDYGVGKNQDVTVLNADNIKIEIAGQEIQPVDKTLGNSFYQSISMLNKDMLSLDSTLESLTRPGVKYTPQQLLTLQAGVSQVSILAEGVTRVVQEAAKTFNTLGMQIQV